MNVLFELFRGGVVFEVGNIKEAKIAEQAGAVALLLDMDSSPIHPDGNTKILREILDTIRIPLLASFRPGHFVEAEMLAQFGIWGVYADSRFHPIDSGTSVQPILSLVPVIKDIHSFEDREEGVVSVLRAHDAVDEVFPLLDEKEEGDFLFVAGPIETVSDVALLRRKGADVLLLPRSIFQFADSSQYTKKLVLASFFFDDIEKLSSLLEAEKEEKQKKEHE